MICELTPNLMRKAVFIVSHPRSGTHLVIDLLRKNFQDFRGWKLPFFPGSSLFLTEKQIRSVMAASHSNFFWGARLKRPIIKSHAMADHQDWSRYDTMFFLPKDKPILYIYRNPLHVITSYYSYEINRGMIPRTFEDFVKENNAKRLRGWQQHVEGYLGRDNVCPLEYSTILQDTTKSLHIISRYIKENSKTSDFPSLPAKPRFSFGEVLKTRLLPMPESTAVLAPKLILGEHELRMARELINDTLGNFLKQIKMVI